MFDLQHKVAIVTGASRGIGGGLAIALAQAGANVLLVSRSQPDQWITDALGEADTKSLHFAADLSLMSSVHPVITAALEHFGQIDILVNNAGMLRRKDFLDQTEDDWDTVLNTNLKVPYFLSQAVARHLIERGSGGKIINICSVLSTQGGFRVSGYVSSKHGIAGMTKALANELASHGINVNGIAPGYFDTDINTELKNDAVRLPQIMARIPHGRLGVPSDLAGAVVFLASAASDYINGTILTVDGGWLSR
ncbi:MAG: glucose 1-dehydrogenase [Anaerolineae bacterium]